VRDGLRPGALHLHVRPGTLLPLLHRGQPGAFGLGQRGHVGRVAGRERDQGVEVHADDPVRGRAAHERGDEGAYVPALHAVAAVAEPVHQLGQRGGGAAIRPAGLGQRSGEAVAGQRRDDQMEGVGWVAAAGGRVGERADQVGEFHDRAGPAVQQQQRRGLRLGGADVQEVQLRAVDGGTELGVGVEGGLVRPPVVLRGPVGGQLAQIGSWYATFPAGATSRSPSPRRPTGTRPASCSARRWRTSRAAPHRPRAGWKPPARTPESCIPGRTPWTSWPCSSGSRASTSRCSTRPSSFPSCRPWPGACAGAPMPPQAPARSGAARPPPCRRWWRYHRGSGRRPGCAGSARRARRASGTS
jgi:hypothetical protein